MGNPQDVTKPAGSCSVFVHEDAKVWLRRRLGDGQEIPKTTGAVLEDIPETASAMSLGIPPDLASSPSPDVHASISDKFVGASQPLSLNQHRRPKFGAHIMPRQEGKD